MPRSREQIHRLNLPDPIPKLTEHGAVSAQRFGLAGDIHHPTDVPSGDLCDQLAGRALAGRVDHRRAEGYVGAVLGQGEEQDVGEGEKNDGDEEGRHGLGFFSKKLKNIVFTNTIYKAAFSASPFFVFRCKPFLNVHIGFAVVTKP